MIGVFPFSENASKVISYSQMRVTAMASMKKVSNAFEIIE